MITKILVQIVLTVLSFTALSAYSQITFGFYDVNDVLSGTKKTETWFTQQVKPSLGIYFSKKVAVATAKNIEVETVVTVNNYWLRKVQVVDEKIYHEEFLTTSPNMVTPTETTYGFINVRNSITGEIIEAWPLFLTIESVGRGRKATFTTYLPNNQMKEVIRTFIDEGYFFPSIEEIKIYKPGVIASLVPKDIEPFLFLEKYTIARRKD